MLPSSPMGGGGGSTPDGNPSGIASTQKDREAALMRQHRSGVRRFSITSAPYLHPARSPSTAEKMPDEFDEEMEQEKPEHIQELHARLQKMYSGIKSHTKAIKAAQQLTDEMASGHYPGDVDDFELQQLQQFASPQQMRPPSISYEMTQETLQIAGVQFNSTPIWHKHKRKWKPYSFDFEFRLHDPNQPANVCLILTNKKSETMTYRFSHNSEFAKAPDEYEHHNEKATRKRNKKVRDKAELHLFPSANNMELVMLDTPSQRKAMKQAVNGIIDGLRKHHNKRESMPPMPPQGPEDPQIAMDKAQNFMPSGAGLFDGAVVGEEATFDIEAKHPMDENNRPYTKNEMQALLPPEYDEYGEEIHPGHRGGPHRLNVQLFSITQHEFDNGVGVSIDPESESGGESKAAGGSSVLVTAGGAGHQYDLRPTIMAVDGDGNPVAENDEEYGYEDYGYHDSGDKTYHFQCKYTISRVGLYRVSIKLGNHHVYGSPYDLEGIPGAAYAKASVGYGKGLTQAHPYKMNEFVIEARDRLGNKRAEGGDAYFVEIEGPAAICVPDLTQAQKSAVATLAELFEPNQNVLERTTNFLTTGFEKSHSGAQVPIMSLPSVTGDDALAAVRQAVAALPVDMDVIDERDKTRDALAPVPQIIRMRVNCPAVDNGDGTYIVRYSINNGELPSAYPLKIFVKIDDGTMFNTNSVDLYKKNNDVMRIQHREDHDMEDTYNDPEYYEAEDDTDDVMDEITRPVYESRVNIVRSPFEVPITENTVLSAGGNAAAARPLASNDPGAEETISKSNSGTSGSGGALSFSKEAFHSDHMAGGANASSAALVAKRMELDRREAQIKQMEERLTAQARALEKAKQAAAALDQKQQQQKRSFAPERLSTPSSNTSYVAADAGAKYSTKTDEPAVRSKALVTPGPSQNSPAAFSNGGTSVVSDEAQGLLRRSRPALQSLFDTYSNNNLVTLKQFFRLCADFDLYPTFLTRAGVKKCFEKVAGQRSIDFEGFVSALYEVAMYSLSKEMYRDLYPNDSDKVQVLLNLWGVASPEKLAQVNVRRRLEEQNLR